MAAGGGQQGGADNTLAPVLIGGFIVVVIVLLWHYQHTVIVRFVFALNIIQAWIVDFFLPGDPLAELIAYMQTVDASKVDWNNLVNVSVQIGNYIRYFYMAILIILAFILYQKDLSHKFCKIYSMQSLSNQEQENWPAISPVVKEGLAQQDIDVGPWAMALNPMEFARKYHLLKQNDLLVDPNVPGQEMTASIKKGDAKRIFTMQLGPLWRGFENCQPHVIALSAIFLARMNRDREAAKHISDQLSKSFAKGKIDYSSAYPVLKKYQNNEEVKELQQIHAYVYTFMASLIEKARNDGVVPTSEFLWLKPIDRRLWYMLNCVGRQTPFAEIGGAFAHWKAEKKMNRRSLSPMIDEAVKALELAIKDVKLSAKELQELPK
jgi:intracellular multiplication protein IcmP